MKKDPKELWLIESLRDRISGADFDEFDCLGLLMLLRQHCPAAHVVRELADFVAHREKDRGILKDYLQRIQQSFHVPPASRGEPVALPIYTWREIRTGLSNILESLGIAGFDDVVGNHVTVAAISLLQGVSVKVSGIPRPLKLAIAVSNEHITLLGEAILPAGHTVVFPLIMAENRYVVLNGFPGPIVLQRVARTKISGGRLALDQVGPEA